MDKGILDQKTLEEFEELRLETESPNEVSLEELKRAFELDPANPELEMAVLERLLKEVEREEFGEWAHEAQSPLDSRGLGEVSRSLDKHRFQEVEEFVRRLERTSVRSMSKDSLEHAERELKRNIDEARYPLEIALKSQPENPSLLLGLAKYHDLAGEFDAAERMILRAIERRAEVGLTFMNSDAWEFLGRLRLKQGRDREARQIAGLLLADWTSRGQGLKLMTEVQQKINPLLGTWWRAIHRIVGPANVGWAGWIPELVLMALVIGLLIASTFMEALKTYETWIAWGALGALFFDSTLWARYGLRREIRVARNETDPESELRLLRRQVDQALASQEKFLALLPDEVSTRLAEAFFKGHFSGLAKVFLASEAEGLVLRKKEKRTVLKWASEATEAQLDLGRMQLKQGNTREARRIAGKLLAGDRYSKAMGLELMIEVKQRIHPLLGVWWKTIRYRKRCASSEWHGWFLKPWAWIVVFVLFPLVLDFTWILGLIGFVVVLLFLLWGADWLARHLIRWEIQVARNDGAPPSRS